MSKTPSRPEIEAVLRKGSGWPDTKSDWFHRMDLGDGLVTPAQTGEGLLPVARLLGSVKLKGLRCLDIGTMDGKMAFLMERQGASEVVAVDVFNRDTITSLIGLFGSKVKYQSGVRGEDLPKLRDSFGWFDFVLCVGVLYHVYSPLSMILAVRGLLKNGGLAIFESACLDDTKNVTLTLNRGDIYDDHTTIWVPSIACLQWMLTYAGFRPVACGTLLGSVSGVPRHAVLAEAISPGEENDSHPWINAMHQGRASWAFGYEYLKPELDLQKWAAAPRIQIPCERIKEFRMDFGKKKSYAAEETFLELGTPAGLGSES